MGVREAAGGGGGGGKSDATEQADRSGSLEQAPKAPLSSKELKSRLMEALQAIKAAEAGGYYDREKVDKVGGTEACVPCGPGCVCCEGRWALLDCRSSRIRDVDMRSCTPHPEAPVKLYCPTFTGSRPSACLQLRRRAGRLAGRLEEAKRSEGAAELP